MNNIANLTAKNQDQFQSAKKIHSLGFNVLPCDPVSKKALVKWEHFQTHDVTTADLEKWRSHFWNCNWLIMMGRGWITLDADDENAVRRLQACCQPTPLVTYSKRGQHWTYRYYDNPPLKNDRYDKLHAIDIRTNGGLVVAPGSRRLCGFIYHAQTDWTPELLKAVPVFNPDWLGIGQQISEDGTRRDWDKERENASSSEDLDRARQYGEHLEHCPGAVQSKGSGADHYCARLAIVGIWDFLVKKDLAIAKLYDWGQKPGNVHADGSPYLWSEDQIERKIDYAIRSGTPTEGHLPGWRYRPKTLHLPEPAPVEVATTNEPELLNWTWADIAAMSRKNNYIVEGLLEVGGINILASVSFAGKTTLLGALIAAVMEGKNFFDFPCVQTPVLYIGTDRARIWRLQDLIALHMTGEGSTDYFQAYKYHLLPQVVKTGDIEKSADQLKRNTNRENILIVVDTLRSAFLGEAEKGAETDSVEMLKAMKPLQKLAKDGGDTLHMLHHSPKYVKGYSGSGAIPNLTDSVWIYEREETSAIADLSIQTRDGYHSMRVHYDWETKRLTRWAGCGGDDERIAIANLFKEPKAVSEVQPTYTGCQRSHFIDVVNELDADNEQRKAFPKLRKVRKHAGNIPALYQMVTN